jgi:uncharacterized membrane protein SpoIIM required for sporulation
MQPIIFNLVGIGSSVLSKTGKRIGDIAAGTIVIQERLVETPAGEKRRPAKSAAATTPAIAVLTEADFRLIERWYARRLDFDPERRKVLTEQIGARVERFLPGDADVPLPTRLSNLYESERAAREAGAASRNETGAARERYAIVSTSSPRWLAFAATVATAQKKGLKSLGEAKVREFVAEYRALAGDLARLRTASRDVEADELFYLGRLVGSAHNLLYKERGTTLAAFLRFMLGDVPREVRRSFRPIALAAVLLFLPGVIAGTAVIRNPAVASVFIPPSMLDRANEGVKRAADGSGYIDDPQIFRPLMASGIIRNNIQVTFVVFAFGIAAGAGTALMLVLNGVSLGGVIGLYQSKGILPLLIAFVAPHGILELTAVCIAGGAGFLLAAALLIPGRRTRRAAFVDNGRRAMRLIAASTLLLIIAGLLEGLVSPIPYWPLQWKLAVSAATALLLYIFLRGGVAPRAAVAGTDAEPDLFALSSAGVR